MIVYKIRSKKTGEFSTGGTYPSFDKNGKVWKKFNHVSSHLSQQEILSSNLYKEHDAEIVEYELRECAAMTVETIVAAKMDRKADRDRKMREYRDGERQSYRRQEYEQLKKEFE